MFVLFRSEHNFEMRDLIKRRMFSRAGRRSGPVTLERLRGLNGFLERLIEFPMLGDTASQDGFKIGQIGHVDDLIDTVNERGHRVVRRKTMAEQDDEKVSPIRAGAVRHLGEDWIRLERAAFEVLVDDDHVVDVGLELENDVFSEQTEVHLVVDVDQLRHNDLLILLMIQANQCCAVAQIKKCFCVLFHG